MLYRRKVILAILETWVEAVPLTDFQKILLLFTKKQENSAYDFVPYKYGGFSFTSYVDRRFMIKQGLLLNNDRRWIKGNISKTYDSVLNPKDQIILRNLYKSTSHLKGNELVRHVYRAHPYYAIKSEIAEKLLNKHELDVVKSLKPEENNRVLFTIGYQGKSFEQYLDDLIRNNVKILFDLRKNPVSMKYGFSKRTLSDTLKNLGIEYIHIPQLGIESAKRKNLKKKADYEKLFAQYEKTTLRKSKYWIEYIKKFLLKENRIALTCFEADFRSCHRYRVSKALSDLLEEGTYSVKHI